MKAVAPWPLRASPRGLARGNLVKTRGRSKEVETKQQLAVEAGTQMATLLDQHCRHKNQKEKMSREQTA